MSVISEISNFSDDLVSIRRDLHEHPELGMEEISTFISHYYKKPYHKMMNHESYPYE